MGVTGFFAAYVLRDWGHGVFSGVNESVTGDAAAVSRVGRLP